MKIVVSATGTEMSSAVDPRFGRAAYLLLVDSETMAVVRVIDNQAAQDAAHGAGINAATMVAQAGVDAVLSGRVGPKAEKVLAGANIIIYNNAQGTVAEAVAQAVSDDGTAGGNSAAGCRRMGGAGRGRGGQGQGCGGNGQGRGRGKQGMGQGRRA